MVDSEERCKFDLGAKGLTLELLLVFDTICNLSLSYPYIIQQTGSENHQTYQAQVVTLIYMPLGRIVFKTIGASDQ